MYYLQFLANQSGAATVIPALVTYIDVWYIWTNKQNKQSSERLPANSVPYSSWSLMGDIERVPTKRLELSIIDQPRDVRSSFNF